MHLDGISCICGSLASGAIKECCQAPSRNAASLAKPGGEITGAYPRQLTRTKAVIEEGCQVAEALLQQGGVGGERVKAHQQLPPQLLGPAAAHHICSHKALSRCCMRVEGDL